MIYNCLGWTWIFGLFKILYLVNFLFCLFHIFNWQDETLRQDVTILLVLLKLSLLISYFIDNYHLKLDLRKILFYLEFLCGLITHLIWNSNYSLKCILFNWKHSTDKDTYVTPLSESLLVLVTMFSCIIIKSSKSLI